MSFSFGGMSLGGDLKFTVLHVKWKVNITRTELSQNHTDTSSSFRYLDNKWRLHIQAVGNCHRLQLLSEKRTVPVKGFGQLGVPTTTTAEQFFVTVHVLSATTGLVLPALTSTTRLNDEVPQISIWERSTKETEVLTNSLLTFLLVFAATGNNSTSTLCNSALPAQTTSKVPCLESLSEDFSKLLDQGSDTDVEFQCADQSTKAHGAVVSARSQVIASMLASDLIEGKTKVVKIPDMEPDIFKKFLRYLYTGKLDELTFEVALNLFEAGDQYAVTGLAKRCSEYLVEHLSAQNACKVLVIADAHSDKGLVEKVVDYMVDKRVPLTSEVWPAFCDEHPRLSIKVLNRGWKVLLK